MKDFDLSITICSWNTVEDLRACLVSLRFETKPNSKLSSSITTLKMDRP